MFKYILLNLLKERGITQAELAKFADIPKTTISGWLKADRCPDYSALKKLAQFFDVSADYLLELETEDGSKIRIHNSFNNFSGNGNIQIGNKNKNK